MRLKADVLRIADSWVEEVVVLVDRQSGGHGTQVGKRFFLPGHVNCLEEVWYRDRSNDPDDGDDDQEFDERESTIRIFWRRSHDCFLLG